MAISWYNRTEALWRVRSIGCIVCVLVWYMYRPTSKPYITTVHTDRLPAQVRARMVPIQELLLSTAQSSLMHTVIPDRSRESILSTCAAPIEQCSHNNPFKDIYNTIQQHAPFIKSIAVRRRSWYRFTVEYQRKSIGALFNEEYGITATGNLIPADQLYAEERHIVPHISTISTPPSPDEAIYWYRVCKALPAWLTEQATIHLIDPTTLIFYPHAYPALLGICGESTLWTEELASAYKRLTEYLHHKKCMKGAIGWKIDTRTAPYLIVTPWYSTDQFHVHSVHHPGQKSCDESVCNPDRALLYLSNTRGAPDES